MLASDRPQGDSPAWRLKPVAAVVAALMAGGLSLPQAAQASAWFAATGAGKSAAAAAGPSARLQAAGQGRNSAAAQQAAAQQKLARSIENLNRTAGAIAAQQAAQAAARQAAQAAPGGVPDGLAEGGLKVDASLPADLRWINARAPVQSTAGGRTQVDIEQTADRAILNWETFNVGRNTTVQFRQDRTWAVLNRVNDPQARPSQIQGQIKADGTVMIVNRNGVVFDGGSQVNVRNLVAAAAAITDEQFRDRGLYADANGSQPTFTEAAGAIRVEKGAQIATAAPASSTDGGGYVLLLGSEVANAGAIATPRGQAVLAAGDSFYVRKGAGIGTNANSTTAGNEVSTWRDADGTAGTVVNTGLIAAATGDITMTGHDVTQAGVAVVTTSTSQRGTIHLSTRASDATGTVTLARGSITTALLDTATSALDSQRDAAQERLDGITDAANNATGVFDNLGMVKDRRDLSRIEIVSGNTVDFQGDSMTLATGGEITVSAAHRTRVDAGATLDVSGAVGVRVAMQDNNLKINIQGNEQRDAPLNRDSGKLNNQDVWVDRRSLLFVPGGTGGYEGERWYTAGGLLEVGGYLATSAHGTGEWMAQGGTITVTGNDLVTRAGSDINLSGGTLDVAAGTLNLSWLKGADGRLYEVSRAPADVIYAGVYRGYEDASARWGVTNYYRSPVIGPSQRRESGYTVGRDAGKLVVATGNAVLEGGITGEVYLGPRQTEAAQAELDGYSQSQYAVARAGQLVVGEYTPIFDADARLLRYRLTPRFDSVTLAEVRARVADGLRLDDPVADDRQGRLVLDTGLLGEAGLGMVRIAAKETIAVEDALAVAPGGEIALHAPTVDVAADLTAHSGAIRLSNLLAQPYFTIDSATGKTAYGVRDEAIAVPAQPGGGIRVREGVVLDATGLLSDLRQVGPDRSGARAYVDGGSVSLRSTESVALAGGSLIDVSAGAQVGPGGDVRGGSGGSVELGAGASRPSVAGNAAATLALDGGIRGYGVEGGGTLKIETASAVVIGEPSGQAQATALATDLFQAGFTSYDINGYGGLRVAEGTRLDVIVPVYRIAPAGPDAPAMLQVWTPPAYLEDPAGAVLTPRTGASLALGSGTRYSASGGVLEIGRGAAVSVDPGQTIALAAAGQITLDGVLNAWGGRITITDPAERSYAASAQPKSVWIGEHAVLDVAGRATVAVDAQGRRYGIVQDGGSIDVGGALDWEDTANNANRPSDRFLIIRPGAVLDASGARAVLDVAQASGVGRAAQPLPVAGDGGSIILRSANGLYLDGALRAAAGGNGAAGGTLGIAFSGAIWPEPADAAVMAPRVITLAERQGASPLSATLRAGQADASLAYGYARLGLDTIAAGGFDHLSLQGDLRAETSLSLRAGGSVRLYGSLGHAGESPQPVTLSVAAPYVRLAQSEYSVPFTSEHTTSPASAPLRTAGGDRLSVQADLIDIRDAIDFAGFDDVLLASRGDIRLLDGKMARPANASWPTQLLAPSSLTLSAAQIYPATGVRARITVGISPDSVNAGNTVIANPDGRLFIRSSGGAAPPVPYSAFGILALSAARIDQGGVVRAPLGTLQLTAGSADPSAPAQLTILPGSLTSVSAAGLAMPYGGTVDGIRYTYGGEEVALETVLGYVEDKRGIMLSGARIDVREGAVIDLSGGGELTGAGFSSGRGGSVDILRTALANANPAYAFSRPDNAVYAIVPGYGGGYAPAAPDAGAGDPAVGQQVTIPEGVPGLPAGTYTLMPSTYALLPGAFRVEIGAQGQSGIQGVAALRNGSYIAPGTLGVAHTGASRSLPSQIILTPADTVRTHSAYNETGYNAFVAADAARRGIPRGLTTYDARSLMLTFASGAGLGATPALSFDGLGRFAPAAGTDGYGGSLIVRDNVDKSIEILADGQRAAGTTGVAVYASDISAFDAARIVIGSLGSQLYGENLPISVGGSASVLVRSGAVLTAPEVFLGTSLSSSAENKGIVIEPGAVISTVGQGAPAYDSTDGYFYTGNMVAVSNGWLNTVAPTRDGMTIDIGRCVSECGGQAVIATEGTFAVATAGAFTLDKGVSYGARHLMLGVSAVNLGTEAALGAAADAGRLPPGLTLNQAVLSGLLRGNTAIGTPALETLALNANESFNLFGSVELNTLDTGSGASSVQRLVFGTPAIYGYGAADDVVTITAGEFIWSGAVAASNQAGSATPAAPGAAMADRLGDSRLNVVADRILLGYAPNTRPNTIVSADRLALGFSAVNLAASERITSSGKGSLAVYHRQGSYVAGAGWQHAGGDLTLASPLVTGEAGSVNRITAGGAIVLTGAGHTAGSDALGATLQLSAGRIDVGTTVALASGKLDLHAEGDITLGGDARIDLAGRGVEMFDLTRYSWGGDLVLSSAGGNITAAAGSRIDLSAAHNRGGTITATALGEGAGRVDLAGTLLGSASGSYDAGGTLVPYDAAELTVRAQVLADFAGLNARLNEGQVYGARRFQIKQGDLAVGDGVKAREVQIVLDGGSLRVDGLIDASGYQVGAIRLAAMGDLTVNGRLDAHGAGLRVDSYGKIIDSPNRAIVDLTSREGTLTLGAGAAIDLRAGTDVAVGTAAGQNDGRARGTLDLNAARVGADDVAIAVGGTLAVQGAKTIAVNAFRTYDDAPLADQPDVSGSRPQLITQAWLDTIDLDSQAFINAALDNASLASRLARLGDYRLRPGVEITSNAQTNPGGNLTVSGDLDLSGYRYGPQADRADPARRGFGEPGVLVIRAAGDLNIHGSINDGFAPPPDSPDDRGAGWVLTEARDDRGGAKTPFGGDIVIPVDGVVLDSGTEFQAGAVLNYDIPVNGATLPAGATLPVAVMLDGNLTLEAGQVLAADVKTADGTVFPAGTVLKEPLVLTPGAWLGAGTTLRNAVAVSAMTWPKGVALPTALTTRTQIALARGALIPSMTKVELPGDQPVNLWPADADGRQNRRNWALAPMLPQGTTSWSLTAVAGADLGSADVRALNAVGRGDIVLADTHYGMKGTTTSSGTFVLTREGSYMLAYDYDMLLGWTEQEILAFVGGTDFARDVFGVSFSEFCSMGNFCVLREDPKVLTEAGSINLAGDTSLVGLTEQQILDMFGYDDFARDVYGIPFNEFCNLGDFCSGGGGNNTYSYAAEYPLYSVLRTGGGDLSLLAGRDVRMSSMFGVYTAGVQTALAGGSEVNAAFNLPRGTRAGQDSVLGKVDESMDYSAALAAYQAWYPDQGGNVLVAAGRDVTGDSWSDRAANGGDLAGMAYYGSAAVGNWLWRQGSGTTAGVDAIDTSWWINFGTYVNTFDDPKATPRVAGFTGIGALGGGNVDIVAGRDAGVVDARGDSMRYTNANRSARSEGLVVAVGSTGRVLGQDLVLTGGGDLSVRIGGMLNPNLPATEHSQQNASFGAQDLDLNGVLVNLRGTLALRGGALGAITDGYSTSGGGVLADDPFVSAAGRGLGGPVLMLGDAVAHIDARGDLVLGSAGDPGRVSVRNDTPYTYNGTPQTGQGRSWFSLWTENTAVNLFAAGGDLMPAEAPSAFDLGSNTSLECIAAGCTVSFPDVLVYPPTLNAVAASGDIKLGAGRHDLTGSRQARESVLLLAPSAGGALELLAGGSIYAQGDYSQSKEALHNYRIGLSGADTGLPTPFAPAFTGYTGNGQNLLAHNLSPDGFATANTLFAFGADTPVDAALHAGNDTPARFYAVRGNVVGLDTGAVLDLSSPSASAGRGPRILTAWYQAGAPVQVRAGGDILGTQVVAVHSNTGDMSVLEAGRDIVHSGVVVAGPGMLEIAAGGNIRMEDRASVTSVGPVVAGDSRPGASIALMAGMTGIDWKALRALYLDPANLADPQRPLADQNGVSEDGTVSSVRKVAKTYEAELADWLQARYGFRGTREEALAYFDALAPEHRRIFLRQVYYAELKAGGREYNDADGPRFGSYLRGRLAIAALFPDRDAAGQAIARSGDILMFGGSGVHTHAGGGIDMMAPGGRIIVGVEGDVPPASAGVVTQGSGDISLFSEQSQLLGLSRIMTTFGGSILGWSEQGDINAGRGSKTTVVYTPPRRAYDAWGNVTISPQAPATGAGIATLAPIPEVPPGDVDLIAPLGTIDAGEAGIRVSGNVNIAALQVVNAANIQVQGESKGIPVAAVVNTGALTSASAAATSAATAAQDAVARSRDAAQKALPSIISVQILGFGDDPRNGGAAPASQPPAAAPAPRPVSYDPDGVVQVIGAGSLGQAQRGRLNAQERGDLPM